MRVIFVSACLLAATACASWEKTEYINTDIGSIGVDEAIGSFRHDIEKRLGLASVDQPLTSSVALEGSILVETVTGFDISRQQRCPNGRLPTLGWRRGDDTWMLPPLIFHDGRLTGYGVQPRLNEDTTKPASLVATCSDTKRAGKDVTRDIVQVAIAAPVLLPIAGLLGGVNAIASLANNDINTPLRDLVLGAPPPGGIDAYLAKPPSSSRIRKREGQTAVVAFYVRTPDNPDNPDRRPTATVTFTNGLVTRFEGQACTFTPRRTYQCG